MFSYVMVIRHEVFTLQNGQFAKLGLHPAKSLFNGDYNGEIPANWFLVLFRDTPHAYVHSLWPDGHMAINDQIWPYMAIWPSGHRLQIWACGVSLKRTSSAVQTRPL